MINIRNLNKVYKSKKRNDCHALQDINLSLPSHGLIFVLGKSGSGKSTLLNLIGGLDSISSGEITVNGNNISHFNENKFADYRNTYIGYIFQDYHLIDELTVYENIKLSLELRNHTDDNLILEALEKVGLAGYDNRYPTELSGGERQRVAIARAIVKKPRIILADEPTGNLDNKTATAIIKILKQLSKECLILIVSHNTNDAYTYADRIIELSQGKIISDYTKNPEYSDDIIYDHEVMYYPNDHLLTDEDVEHINDMIDHHQLKKVVKVKNKFLKTENVIKDDDFVEIENNKLSFRDVSFLSFRFLKSKLIRILTSSIMVAIIMVILAFSQTIISFDAESILAEQLETMQQDSILYETRVSELKKPLLDTNYRPEIGTEDIQAFKNAGYEGNIYPVTNYTVPITAASIYSGLVKTHLSSSMFVTESLGTLIVDEEYLKGKYGELTYLAKLEEFDPIGVIITDYLADAILALNAKYKKLSYEDLLGNYTTNGSTVNRMIINGIIDTGYKTKHANLIERYKKGELKKITELIINQDKEFLDFYSDLFSKLGYSYSINPNFMEDFKGNQKIQIIYHHKLMIEAEYMGKNISIPFTDRTNAYISNDPTGKYKLNPGEVIMNYKKYNEIFGTEYDTKTLTNFVPHDITIKQYRYYDVDNENLLMTVKVRIAKLTSATSGLFLAADDIYSKFTETCIYYNGLYLNGKENIASTVEVATKLNYVQQNYIIDGIHTMTKAVNVFIPIFRLVSLFLYAGVILILVSFSMKMINDKLHEIGILKALGTKNISLLLIFGLQILLIAILTCFFATSGYFLFIGAANDVLIASLKELAPSHVVLNIDFLRFKGNIALMDIVIVFILAIISLIIPMIKIRNIKPVKIIKTKE